MSAQNEVQNDLIIPLNSKNTFIHFIFRNKQLNKVAYKPIILYFALGGFILILLSIYMFIAVGTIKSVEINYSQCLTSTNCSIGFKVTQEMKAPVYLMYKLDDFYQNHRRYIQSKSNYQLNGFSIKESQAKLCQPFITNADMKVSKSWAGLPLNPSAIASPCGTIAYTYYNDTFSISLNGDPIPIQQTDISWPGDRQGKYRRSANSNSTQWVDPQNEHFINWMRTGGLPNFKKLWGRIERNLAPGNYILTITNNYNIQQWSGNRFVILTTNSSAGGRNYILPVEFLLVGICSIIAIIVIWKKSIEYKRCLELL